MSLNDKLFVTWAIVAFFIAFSGMSTVGRPMNDWLAKLFAVWITIGVALFLFIIWTN